MLFKDWQADDGVGGVAVENNPVLRPGVADVIPGKIAVALVEQMQHIVYHNRRRAQIICPSASVSGLM